jgi:hypothetical protein
MRGAWGVLAGGAVLLASPRLAGQEAYRFAKVAAVAADSISIDVGSAEGLRQWTRVEVVRGARAVAILRVLVLADHQATCTITSRPVPLRIGDYVRFMSSSAPIARVAVTPAPPVPGPPAATPPPVATRRDTSRAPARAPADTVVRPATRIVTPVPGRLTNGGLAAASPPPVASRDTVRPAPKPGPVPPVAARDTARPAPKPAPPSSPTPAVVVRPVDTTAVASRRAPAPTVQAAPSVPKPAPVAGAGVPAVASAPSPTGPVRWARVSFVTTSTAYVSAGKGDGLADSSRIDVFRHGRAVALLKVSFLSTHQAACQIVSVTDSVVVGDSARYISVAPPAVASRTTPAAQRQVASRTSRGSSSGRLRGRLGLYYLTVIQRDTFGGQFSQPSGDVRLFGTGLGGTPLGLVVDVRSRRLVQAFPGSPTTTVDQTRVYQAAMYWQAPGSPVRVTTGRQYAPGITSVGLMDGVATEVNGTTWDFGVFGGLQPELINLGFSGDSISQFGGYVRRHSRTGAVNHWSVIAGASGSYVLSHANLGSTNREYFYLQTNYQTRHVSLYAVQEVDYYRPWRRVGGEKAVSFTSTFANAQYQVTPAFSLTAGIDNRRSVRLYRDVVNPLTIFDDTFRQGIWGGFSVRAARHFRSTFDVRTNHDSASGTANTYTMALGVEQLTPLGLSLRSRSTRYTTGGGSTTVGPRKGWLNSVSIGIEPFGRGSVAVTSGWRSERDSTASTLNIRWMSADMDFTLARSLFAIVSAYRETGGIEAHDLIYAGLNYRF